jgi:hypothetical protein
VIDDAGQHLAHDQGAHLAEQLTVLLRVGLLEHVVPERRLALPSVLVEPALAGTQGLHPHPPRDRLSGRQASRDPPLQVPHGQRLVIDLVEHTRDVLGEVDQRRRQPAVERS